MSTMSILGLQYWDPDNLQPMISRLPAGLDPVTLSGELFAQCAEYEILYPDPETFKTILRYWADGQQAVLGGALVVAHPLDGANLEIFLNRIFHGGSSFLIK